MSFCFMEWEWKLRWTRDEQITFFFSNFSLIFCDVDGRLEQNTKYKWERKKKMKELYKNCVTRWKKNVRIIHKGVALVPLRGGGINFFFWSVSCLCLWIDDGMIIISFSLCFKKMLVVEFCFGSWVHHHGGRFEVVGEWDVFFNCKWEFCVC